MLFEPSQESNSVNAVARIHLRKTLHIMMQNMYLQVSFFFGKKQCTTSSTITLILPQQMALCGLILHEHPFLREDMTKITLA